MNIFCATISLLAANTSLFIVADNLRTANSDTDFVVRNVSYSSSKGIKQYQKWRIWTANAACCTSRSDCSVDDICDAWDVNELEFYSTFDCTGPRLNSGTPIDSGHHVSEKYWPKSAFDGNIDTVWSGRKDEDGDGHFWVGMDFGSLEEVKCVAFRQQSNKVKEVTVQAWESISSTWQNVARNENLREWICDQRDHVIPIYIGTETYTESPPSTGWRIWARNAYMFGDSDRCKGGFWSIDELEFYTTFDCTGPRLSGGTPIDSGHIENYEPKHVFDGTHKQWGGIEDNEGYLWVGMNFDSFKEVKCVSFNQDDSYQHYSGVSEVRVQAWESGSSTWQNVMRKGHVKKGDGDIVIAPKCDGLDKEGCKMEKKVCGYKKKKNLKGDCKAIKSTKADPTKYEHDCKQHTSITTCVAVSNKGLCIWKDGICSHECDDLTQRGCKKKRFMATNNKMCTVPINPNPCYGCHPKSKC